MSGLKGFLAEITPKVRETIASGYYVHEQPRKRKSLAGSLVNARVKGLTPIIAEIKPSSPTEANLVGARDPVLLGRDLIEGGAVALSILTEPKVFGGNIELLKREWSVPVLMKDFVISEKQIGTGDAVLLIMRLMDELKIDPEKMIHYAHARGIEVMLESTNEDEFARALKTEADVLGINNRNLENLQVDLGVTERVLKAVPRDGRPLISESGFSTKSEIHRVAKAGADGVLIGTGVLKSPDAKKKLQELLL
ncbi:Indole-3-glycerol phosphate synthase [Candidatus Gugararchaeum adminiculabundum]|nr:Indole-3-glycerol phosphate synthase [Candidatus Gugararchaeum adminiculabundum]